MNQIEPTRPGLTRGRAVLRLVLFTLLHIGIQIAALFLVTLIWAAFKISAMPGLLEMPDHADFGELTRRVEEIMLSDIGTLTFVSLIVSHVLSIGVYILIIRHQRKDFAPLSAKRPARWRVLPFAIIGTVSACLLVGALLNALLPLLPEGTQTSSLDNITAHPVLIILGVVILAPIAEEMCFRVLCLRNLNGAFAFRIANVMQALLFGVMHLVPLQVAYAFVFGLLLGWLYDRTGRPLVAAISHMAFNFIGAIGLIFPAEVEEAAAAAEGTAVIDPFFTLFLLTVTVGALWCVASMTRQNTAEQSDLTLP